MTSKKRYRDGDRLRASAFNTLLDTVDNNSAEIDVLKKSIPTKTSQLKNDSGFVTKDTNTWRPIKINNKEILGSGINTKPLNLISGKDISMSHDDNGNVTISSSGGGVSYVAGDNIQINKNVISATDTKYKSSDFDIKDLSDSTGLREEWSDKQDTIDDLETIRSGAALGATALQSVPSEYITDSKLATALSEKQDVLTAGDNIEITSGGTINVTGITEPIASDFDIKDLADSTGLREEWSGKQDTIDDLETIRSGAALGATALQSETDPTVPNWAKASKKPTYTAEEVGALPSDTYIPSKTSDLTNDSGYITGYTLPVASANDLGGVKIGDGLEISGAGVVNVVGKQDVLTAGNNIEITSGGTINVTGITEPIASDFDIKDLSDTTGLREEWSGKQDAVSITVEEVIDFLNEPEPTPYELGYNAGKTDVNYGDTPNPYVSGTTEHIEWQEGYEVGWEEEHPQPQPTPYELGYSAGTTDVNYGDTPNPYVSGTTEHTQWQEGYEVGWEETHPQPADELHFWFFNQADAEANNKTNDTNVFNSMWTGSMNNLSGSITIDGVTYTVTKRTGDKATFGNMIVPEGKVATFYALTVSSGGAARQLDLVSDNNTYNITVPGGPSSFSPIEASNIAAGTYSINRNGSGNFRFGMIAVKFSNAV